MIHQIKPFWKLSESEREELVLVDVTVLTKEERGTLEEIARMSEEELEQAGKNEEFLDRHKRLFHNIRLYGNERVVAALPDTYMTYSPRTIHLPGEGTKVEGRAKIDVVPVVFYINKSKT